MPHRNLLIKSSQRRRESRAGVPVDEDDIRFFPDENFLDPPDHIRGNHTEGLIRFHDIQVIIRNQLKKFQYLIQHFPVLCCHAEHGFHIRSFLQFPDQWRHFDRFRTRTKYGHNFHDCFSPSPGETEKNYSSFAVSFPPLSPFSV